MNYRRTLAAGAVAALVFGLGVSPANADDNLGLTLGDATQSGSVSASAQCEPGTEEALFGVGDYERAVVTPAADGSVKADLKLASSEVGIIDITVVCASYNGSVQVQTKSIEVEATQLFITPNRWTAGDTVTITGFGFAPGEQVTLHMIREVDGKTYWTTAAGTADESGELNFPVVLKSDVPLGDYMLVAVGEESGLELSTGFEWGQRESQDDDSDDKGATPTDEAPVTGGQQVPGLPSTGE